MKKSVRGFMDFIRSQGVVGLAVGLAIGTQVTETTKKIVDGFINPFVSFFLSFIMHNPENLEKLQWQVSGPPHELIIRWGLIISFLIKLLAVAAVIYFVIKGLKLDKIDKPKESDKKKA